MRICKVLDIPNTLCQECAKLQTLCLDHKDSGSVPTEQLQ